jgi:hypothetical protein
MHMRASELGWGVRMGHRAEWVPRGLECEERKTEKYPTFERSGACIREMQMPILSRSRLRREDVEEYAGQSPFPFRQ